MNDSQTTPTKEEIAQLESQTRQNLIECAKRALFVFKTDDYRVNVRGAVNFELSIKVLTRDEALMRTKQEYDSDQAQKLTRYLSENFPDQAGRGAGDVAIELLKAAYGEG